MPRLALQIYALPETGQKWSMFRTNPMDGDLSEMCLTGGPYPRGAMQQRPLHPVHDFYLQLKLHLALLLQ